MSQFDGGISVYQRYFVETACGYRRISAQERVQLEFGYESVFQNGGPFAGDDEKGAVLLRFRAADERPNQTKLGDVLVLQANKRRFGRKPEYRSRKDESVPGTVGGE